MAEGDPLVPLTVELGCVGRIGKMNDDLQQRFPVAADLDQRGVNLSQHLLNLDGYGR